MSSDNDPARSDRPPRDATDAGTGQVDSDDTTQADAGMSGGTGASPGEATATPLGTQPQGADQELEEEADRDRG